LIVSYEKIHDQVSLVQAGIDKNIPLPRAAELRLNWCTTGPYRCANEDESGGRKAEE
jgi:hypothetical protein